MREPGECRIHNCTGDSREHKKMTRTDDVWKIQQRAQQSPDHKTELHRQRQPRRSRRAEIPFPGERGYNGRAAEPERHAEQFGDREQR